MLRASKITAPPLVSKAAKESAVKPSNVLKEDSNVEMRDEDEPMETVHFNGDDGVDYAGLYSVYCTTVLYPQ